MLNEENLKSLKVYDFGYTLITLMTKLMHDKTKHSTLEIATFKTFYN